MPQKHITPTGTSVDDESLPPAGSDEIYFEALEQGICLLPACKGCGKWNWPVCFRCPECGTWENEWRQVELAGTIFTWTRTWHGFEGLEAMKMPYVSVVVELDTAPGVRLMGVMAEGEAESAMGAKVVGTPRHLTVGGQKVPGISWRHA